MTGRQAKPEAPRAKPGAVPTSPRLEELDAERLARDVQALLVHKLGELAALLGQPVAAPLEVSPILLGRIQSVLTWARLGQGRAKGVKALEQLESAIYGRAADELLETTPTVGPFRSTLVDIETPIGTALAAARARFDLEDSRPTTGRELAALAGVHRTRIGQLLRGGELVYHEPGSGRTNTTISVESARAWLRSRSVPGF